VLVEVERDGAVVTLTLRRPEALNAIDSAMFGELDAALASVAADPDVRVVVLAGAGRSFCAGVDLKAPGEGLNDLAASVLGRLTTMPQIVVAKVHGHCVTGGLELALACDLVVAADDARFADTHARWGLVPAWGMTQRLPRIVGIARARELSYTGRTITGAEAAAWGLVARAVPAAELDAAVAELVASITANSPAALAAYKDLYGVAMETTLAEGLAREAAATHVVADAADRLTSFP
jgi:enoyl-CoA hydratase